MRPGVLASSWFAIAGALLAAQPARAQTDAVAPPAASPPAAAEPLPPAAPPPAAEPPPPPASAPPVAVPPPPPPAFPPGTPPYAPPPGYPAYAPPATYDVPAISVPAAAPRGPGRTPAEDPQADRGVLMPTAYTHPKGTWFISDYELALVQIGAALTDDTQLSLTTVPPVSAERIAFIDLTLKTSLYRGGRVRVAALGSTSGIVAKELGVLGVGRAGAVAQVCLELGCESSVSMSSNLTLAGIMLMVNGVSGIFRVGRTLSLLAELDSLVPLAHDAGEFGGSIAGGGLRWHWTNWGMDLSVMHVLRHANATIPVLALTYRSAP